LGDTFQLVPFFFIFHRHNRVQGFKKYGFDFFHGNQNETFFLYFQITGGPQNKSVQGRIIIQMLNLHEMGEKLSVYLEVETVVI
jgi:hypothetical protein